MTIFKTFLHVLNKIKSTIIIYTLILIVFSFSSLQSSSPMSDFVEIKPDIIIINNDNSKLADNLVNYLEEKCNVNKNIDTNNNDLLNDSLFHRIVSYIIYIPSGYGHDILNGKNVNIDVKKTGDYESSYTDMILDNYFSVAKVYTNYNMEETDIIDSINNALNHDTDVIVTSKIDTSSINNATYYFNFASYSLTACILYIIGLIMSIFKNEYVNKRTIISSTSYKKVNRILLLSNSLFSCMLWLLYIIISFILLKDIMLTSTGLVYIINAFIFTISITSLAFFITSLINKKEAMSGLVNIVALGSAFTCGAFVPVTFLPSGVLKFAHILPSYYYINSNEMLKTIEVINFNSLKPIINNSVILLLFSVLFLVLTNIVAHIKNK